MTWPIGSPCILLTHTPPSHSIHPTGSPVYAGAWSPESDQVLYASAGLLYLKPMQPTMKPSQWRAHEGVILALDWSLATGLIVSGGEDRRYKVWDMFGRALYTSLPHDCPITSLSWSPDGRCQHAAMLIMHVDVTVCIGPL